VADALPTNATPASPRQREGFHSDFRRFFIRGLSALLPTLITLWLLQWAWNFLWESMGRYVILAIQRLWLATGHSPPSADDTTMAWAWSDLEGNYVFGTKIIGVVIATILVYLLGVLIGNFIGRTAYKLIENAVMRIPFIRAIYPAVKQITDFLLADRKSSQFSGSRVVAVRPHSNSIWSIGLVTGTGVRHLSDVTGSEMTTVFVPSSPTAFSGYVLVVPRENVVDLPLTVEEALRLLVSGGVLTPEGRSALPASSAPENPAQNAPDPRGALA
jgi:uncharacterized membrane protein